MTGVVVVQRAHPPQLDDGPVRAIAITPDEHRVAASIASRTARTSYTIGRATLRRLCATLLGVDPLDVPLVSGPGGRPEIAGADLQVSLAHCPGYVVAAAGVTGPIGVDVELAARYERRLERHVLDDRQRAAIDAVDPEGRADAFIRLWAVKEACVKASGARLKDMRRLPGDLRWTAWSPAHGVHAALAASA